ncbi:hypothetical protein SAMN04515678_109184 [Roseivivax sediminis]|uniref:Uncharacterized protein n=1 Tax=Roseivivax sediminis TaxID=936889 RepID=A0A1I2ADK5_9RHOB|nr:hypothetical protein SAMN04515678_109184 [Roseivivax sediminis]
MLRSRTADTFRLIPHGQAGHLSIAVGVAEAGAKYPARAVPTDASRPGGVPPACYGRMAGFACVLWMQDRIVF